jgi:phosphoribosylanthranilate isomerase
MKVKVCGITSYVDAAAALDHGVDALGFNFYAPSPRYIRPREAQEIIRRLPALAITVGVFVNLKETLELESVAREAGVHVLQLHGDESPEYCRRLTSWTLIKVLRFGREPLEADPSAYAVQAFLLDARDDALFGGTGKTFDWSRSAEIGKLGPIILAGGLTSDNVASAIREVQPYGLDVCSGVESRPGKKDPAKLREFMDEVRNASTRYGP